MTLIALLPNLLAVATWVAAPQVPIERYDEAPTETHSFSLPDTRLVRALYESAEGHTAARRWREALGDYQRILEDHAGDLLPGERPRNTTGHVSDQLVHPGAAQRVRDRLFELPLEARALYAERHGREAHGSFESARAIGDERGLVEVARRWPLTSAAASAWLTLGDLELEAGRTAQSVHAWARGVAYLLGDPYAAPTTVAGWEDARRRLEAAGPVPTGVAQRIDSAMGVARGDVAQDAPRSRASNDLALARELRLPGDDERAGPPPGAQDDAWPDNYRLPWHPLQSAARGDGVFAAKSGDRLFVTTGLRLLCLSAFGGTLLWDSGEPAGWEKLDDKDREERFKGVDEDAVLLAPAVDDDVAIAALQVDFARLKFEQFQRIDITRPIPERRLHAFDARTGSLLWSHAPPPKWDGESGDLATRFTCAGPPVIADGRVIVPLVRMQGRIDLHVAAFDVRDGTLAWSTALISGQRELNMFGRPEHEFCAPPVRVEGDRVIVLTQLGAIAAVDLFHGGILWETLYDQIALPPTQDFRAPTRITPWRNCPVVVSDGVVVALPFDSDSAIGLDVSTGAVAWQWRSDRIHALAKSPSGSIDQLLGASGRTVYLGGDRIAALEFGGGLRSAERPRVRWAWPDDDESRYRVGRPALIGERIVVPFAAERIELAATDGRVMDRIPWPGGDGGGNLLSVPGELYTSNPLHVRGIFEWTALLSRAREELAARPRDGDAALALARLLSGRAAADWARGEVGPARTRYAEAREVLEAALGGGRGADPAVVLELVNTLRGEARVVARLADSELALELLRRAREIATTPTAVRDTLLDRIAILSARGAEEREAILAALTDLEKTSGADPMLVEIADVRDDPSLALRIALAPVTRPEESTESTFEIPCGLWVLFERASAHAVSGDTAAEFADLHAILERFGELEVAGVTFGDLAAERIRALLDAGRTAGYEPFEARARANLEAARAAKDGEALARVARDHPGSRASREANDALLGLGLEQGDLAAVARILAGEFATEVPSGVLDDRTARLLVHLAETARRAGNRALTAGLLATLADARPDFVPGAPAFDGRTLRQLSDTEPRFPTWAGLSEVARFQGDFREREVWVGDFEVLGIALAEAAVGEAPATAAREMVVLQSTPSREGRGAIVRLLPSDDPATPRWVAEIQAAEMPRVSGPEPWSRRAAFAPGRVVLALREEIRALDTATGAVAWSKKPEGEYDSLSVDAASGVVLVSVSARGERPRLEAYDATGGALLWHTAIADGGLHRTPLVSERHVVLLPASGQTRGSARDLYTGRLLARFELPAPAVGAVDQEAWVERGLVVVPWFREMRLAERNQIVAFDLERGTLAWRVPFESAEKQMLSGIVQQGARTWLRIAAVPRGEDPALATPRLVELSVGIGATTPLDAARLGPEDVILGLSRDTRVRLPEGPLLVLSPRGPRDGTLREGRLRAIDPERGELWVQGLGLPFDDLRASGVPQAAWSDSTAVIALPLYDSKQRPPEMKTLVSVYDRATGAFRETRKVERLDKADQPRLFAFGEVLLLRRPKTLEILR